MSATTIAYKLPDLFPAATSDVGLLARRLIEYADFSVVGKLYDALMEARRDDDARTLLKNFGLRASQMFAVSQFANANKYRDYVRADWADLSWVTFVKIALLPTFWFDLFDMTETLAEMEKTLNAVRNPQKMKIDPAIDAALRGMANLTAGGTISPGQMLCADENGHAVPAIPSEQGGGAAIHVYGDSRAELYAAMGLREPLDHSSDTPSPEQADSAEQPAAEPDPE